MGLETGTYISDLVATNPLSSDPESQGDDHIRLHKAASQATFPNADRPFRFPEFLAKSANYTILAADDNKDIYCNTGSAFTLTLPTPTFDGWLVHVVKQTTDVNPVFVVPPSGTINGVAKIRVNVPYVRHTFVWTGSEFIHITAFGVRPGVSENYHGATAPVGYVFCYGQSLGTAADFPEINAALGGVVLPDIRGRGEVGRDDMGGSAAGRVTVAGSGLNGTTLGAAGGSETHTLIEAKLPIISKTPTITVNHNAYNYNGGFSSVRADLAQANVALHLSFGLATISAAVTVAFGGGEAQAHMPPSLVCNKIMRLC